MQAPAEIQTFVTTLLILKTMQKNPSSCSNLANRLNLLMLTLVIMLGFNFDLNKYPSILNSNLEFKFLHKGGGKQKSKRNIISTFALLQLGIHRWQHMHW